jgi:hypothetical protein
LTPVTIALAGTVYAFIQDRADTAQKTADRVAGYVRSLNSDAREERLAAVVLLNWERQRNPTDFPSDILSLLPTLANVAANDVDDKVATEAKKLVAQVPAAGDSALKAALSSIPARVYLHIPTTEQRRIAERVSQALQYEGANVPLVNRVDTAPPETQLRYFRDTEQEEAKRLLEVIKEAGVADAVLQFIRTDSTRMRPRHYELWFKRP